MSIESYVRGVRKDLARDVLTEATKSALQSEYNNNQAPAYNFMESIEDYYYTIKNTIEQLPLEQQAAIANVSACIAFLICFTSIVGIFARDRLIEYFRLEER